jgi:hypothetical protein
MKKAWIIAGLSLGFSSVKESRPAGDLAPVRR